MRALSHGLLELPEELFLAPLIQPADTGAVNGIDHRGMRHMQVDRVADARATGEIAKSLRRARRHDHLAGVNLDDHIGW
ncbi:MAG: hypothetical protein DLM68_14145 [Hyphomicrobiales bacterium]|nr:MAG: hypothetical protein DLM68_14145 [Hyphomicrobiales bacterium]